MSNRLRELTYEGYTAFRSYVEVLAEEVYNTRQHSFIKLIPKSRRERLLVEINSNKTLNILIIKKITK